MNPTPEFPLGEMLPFTVDELVRAHVLLGQPEDESQALWTEAVAEIVAQRDSGAETWGVGLAEGTLLALSLLSGDLEERVNRYRGAGRVHNYPFWQSALPPEELRLREEESRRSEEAWQQSREQLRQALFGNAPPA